jgi:hypothetical protein
LRSVRNSARCSKSLSLTGPTIVPSPPTTGMPLMCFSIIRAAMTRTEVSGLTVATSRVMMSCAFMDDLLVS